jgi:outer membrane protein TolC
MTRPILLAAPALMLFSSIVVAQTADSLRLESLQAAAVRADPRQAQRDLLANQSVLRLESLRSERLPTISFDAFGQYQSDVAQIPITLPNGQRPPSPPHDTYDARLSAEQRIFDPTLGPRRALERAQLAESQARVNNSLYSLRQNVNDAYFAALGAQLHIAEIQTSITDLEAQLEVTSARERERSALPSEANTLRAEILRRKQMIAELEATRRASLVILSDLTGERLDTTVALAVPDTAPALAMSFDSLASHRPEYETFARARDVVEAQRAARHSQDLPRVSAFARTGYGKPGLNPLANTFDSYWLGGIQLRWTPWNWGTTDRDREALELQSKIISTEQAAFTAALRRQTARDVADADRLRASLTSDDAIIALRENILAETRVRFGEHVITSAEYVDKETDVLAARIAKATHRVELAATVARYLTTIGAEVR